MDTVIIIPARYASSRLPGKPLRVIAGKPMIEHVYHRARKNGSARRVVVATDSEEILRAVHSFGGEGILTSPDHPTGCDRTAEAARKIPADIYVNLQGDEPLVHPGMIDEILFPLTQDDRETVSTLKSPFPEEEEVSNPNLVKVVVDRNDYALFFSHAAIPRPQHSVPSNVFFLHHGIYAFRREALLAFSDSSPTPLESAERLEQLRFLELGYRIKTPTTSHRSFGVDTEEDLQKVEKIISQSARP